MCQVILWHQKCIQIFVNGFFQHNRLIEKTDMTEGRTLEASKGKKNTTLSFGMAGIIKQISVLKVMR